MIGQSVSRCARRVLVSVVVSLLGQAIETYAADPGLWWRSTSVQREMRLTPQQVARLDTIHAESLPERQRIRQRLTVLQTRLDGQLAHGPFEEADVLPLIKALCAAEKQRNIARTMMLIRFYRVLSPAQLIQLEARWKRLGVTPTPSPEAVSRLP